MRLRLPVFLALGVLAAGTLTRTSPANAQGWRINRDFRELDDDRAALRRDQMRLRRDLQREGGCGPACRRDLRNIQRDRQEIDNDTQRLTRDVMRSFFD